MRASADPARDGTAENEQQRGSQQQPRNDSHERGLGRDQQDARPDDATQNASDDKREQEALCFGRERLAVRYCAGNGSGPDRGGVGRVGCDGRDADKNQRRKGYEASAARYGIDRSRDDCSEKEENWVAEMHAKEYLEAEPKSPERCKFQTQGRLPELPAHRAPRSRRPMSFTLAVTNTDVREGAEKPKNIQKPEHGANDDNGVQNGFDRPLHWNVGVH